MNNQPKTIPLVSWWVIWGALQLGVFVIYFFLAKAEPSGKNPDFPAWLTGFVPLISSTLIRWVVLPIMPLVQTAFPLFVVGIALAEMTTFLGMFLYPAQKEILFLSSVVGIFQFIPIFARRFYKKPEDETSFR